MNYGKRRLLILTDQQIKDGWIRTKHMENRQKKLRITVKKWKKFDLDKQAYLCKIYHVILTDYKIKWRNRKLRKHSSTPFKEKMKMEIKSLPEKMTQENLQKGINMVHNGIEQFSKAANDFHISDQSVKDFKILTDNKKDYSFLTGDSSKKYYTKKKKNHSPKTIKKDYSFLMGNNKVKVF